MQCSVVLSSGSDDCKLKVWDLRIGTTPVTTNSRYTHIQEYEETYVITLITWWMECLDACLVYQFACCDFWHHIVLKYLKITVEGDWRPKITICAVVFLFPQFPQGWLPLIQSPGYPNTTSGCSELSTFLFVQIRNITNYIMTSFKTDFFFLQTNLTCWRML